MAGTILAAGLASITATMVLGAALVGGAATTAHRVTGAADAAALAAADTASGAIFTRDTPCQAAERVAHAANTSITECRLDGVVATVGVKSTYAVMTVVAVARAGPPEAAADSDMQTDTGKPR